MALAREAETSVEAARALFERNDVHTVECMFADTWGIPRGKRLPAKQFLKSPGFAIANVAYTWDMHCVHLPDGVRERHARLPGHARGRDLSTLHVAGWREGPPTASATRSTSSTHEPVALDGRHILRRAVERIRGQGYEPIAATELEFHLCTPDWEPFYRGVTATRSPRAPRSRTSSATSAARSTSRHRGRGLQRRVRSGAGRGQPRLTARPVEVADATMLFKYVVKQTARRHGLRATFMPKPYMGGRQRDAHPPEPRPRRQERVRRARRRARRCTRRSCAGYLTGLVAHQGRAPGGEWPRRSTPTSGSRTTRSRRRQVSWGLDHRLVGRAAASSTTARRRASRHAGPPPTRTRTSCSPAVLAAGADGLEHELELPPMVTGDPHVDEPLRAVPTTLEEAVPSFEQRARPRVYGRRVRRRLRHDAASTRSSCSAGR